jgi:hypothetical protein
MRLGAATAQLALMRHQRPSFHSASIAGQRWAPLPSAAGFVDSLQVRFYEAKPEA